MNIQPIFNIAEILYRQGVRKAILSPGSRNAPLVIALARHPEITCYSIADERSAGFIALGMSRTCHEPVVLACTSGSAGYNYAPAVAEAFFQRIPLIVLTADRPSEWIGQMDGHRTTSDAVLEALEYPRGPVHINLPFREPFYPDPEEEIYYDSDLPVPAVIEADIVLSNDLKQTLINEWTHLPRRLVLGGQQHLHHELISALKAFSINYKIPVIGDIISNLHPLENVIQLGDLYAVEENTDNYSHLSPDLLITYGQSVISKNLKHLFRKQRPRQHWHIQPAGAVADPFQSVTRVIRCSPEEFFREMNQPSGDSDFNMQKQENYQHLWTIEERKTRRVMDQFFTDQPLGEFEIVFETLKALEKDTVVHLANSMAVRYANWCGITPGSEQLEIMANRGACGIDGCSSTAVGAAMVSEKLHLLITGDVGFFYDRNAFWHNYPLNNLRILLLNNHGGGIFRMISGPGQLPELEEFFETNQKLTGKSLADEFQMEYMLCDKKSKIRHFIKDFLQRDDRPKLLEIESSALTNQEILKLFKRRLLMS